MASAVTSGANVDLFSVAEESSSTSLAVETVIVSLTTEESIRGSCSEEDC